MRQVKEETIDHIFKCNEGETMNYEEIFGNNPETQFSVAKEAKKRLKVRKTTKKRLARTPTQTR